VTMTPERATNERLMLAIIVALAVGVRIAAAIFHPGMQPDSVDYHRLAVALSHGGGYEVDGLYAARMPGYPILLAGIYLLVGPAQNVALIVQGFLGGLTVMLAYVIGRRVSSVVGIVAAALAAIDPLSIGFSASLLSEVPFTLVLLAAIWCGLRIMEGGRFGWWVLLGVLWAVAVYLRASVLWCIIPLGLYARWENRKWKIENRKSGGGPIGQIVLPLVIVVLALAPWQMRNFQRFHTGAFSLTSLEGISLYEAVYPDADGGPRQHLLQTPGEMRPLNEMERSQEWSRRAWGYVGADPVRIAKLAAVKIGRTWSPWFNAAEMQAPGIQAVMVVWHVPLFLLALVGVCGRSMLLRMKVLLLVPVVYFSLVHALFLGSVRYRVPLMPIVCIFAAAGAIECLRRFRPQRSAAAAV